MKADFSGWASKAGLLCTDGRVIQPGAFKDKDQKKIPLVWSHRHEEPENVLGHALVEDRPEGVYVYGFFNETPKGQTAKMAVQHGDLDSLSIYANRLEHQGNNVVHGNLVEVSLVLAGANPGAWIENVTLKHSDGEIETLDDAATIWTPADVVQLKHADENGELEEDEEETDEDEDEEETDDEDANADSESVDAVLHSMSDLQRNTTFGLIEKALAHDDSEGTEVSDEDKTIAEAYEAFSPEDKAVVDALVGLALENQNGETAEHSALSHSQEGSTMTNAFDQTLGGVANQARKHLSHDQIKSIIEDAKKPGSTLQKSVLAHADGDTYGITDIDLLFPESKIVGDMPNVLSRVADWVPKVMQGVNQRPFAKIKSISADLTEDEARAKGYLKGTLKKDEVISLLKRETAPTTVYKKQRLDRDDILDITDFDVVAWLKWEIRFMLDEEVARAILVGDGRPAGSDDKIKDPIGQTDGIGIRSIANESELYAITVNIPVDADEDAITDAVAYSQEEYRGSGNPTYFTTNRNLTQLLLKRDRVGRRIYETEQALASALRVKEIVTVPVMEDIEDLYGIIVNLADYSVGTNRGGETTFFSDFDIDFNQNKYLMETRLSGALTKPKSAIVLRKPRGTEVVPTAPAFANNKITIPTKAGVDYRVNGSAVSGTVTIDKDTEVVATAQSGYYIPQTATRSWTYTYTAAVS